LKFRGDFAGHGKKEVVVESQLAGECDSGGFARRRFQAAFNLRKIGRLDSDTSSDLAERIAAGIGLSQFRASFA
jgi:hypothetical protein